MHTHPDSLSWMSQYVLDNLPFCPKSRQILDLGAGDGKHALEFARHGCEVLAVERDPQKQDPKHKHISWICLSIQQALKNASPDQAVRFHAIHLRNSLQFLPPTWVQEELPSFCADHTHPGGLLAIRTFTAPPKPALKGVQATYTASDLTRLFSSFLVLHVQEEHDTKPGDDGKEREWHMLSWIGKRKP